LEITVRKMADGASRRRKYLRADSTKCRRLAAAITWS